MSELLLKIYERVISSEEATFKMELRVNDWVEKLTKDYKKQLREEEMEKLRDLMYSIALKAEQEGFQLGIQFTLQLIKELNTDL